MRYGYDTEGRIATLAATNAANRGIQVSFLNDGGYNYGYTLTTPNGAILTRTITRDRYRRSLTLDCTTRFNNVVVASFAYSFDAHSRPVARNDDRFTYNVRDEILSAAIGTNTINFIYAFDAEDQVDTMLMLGKRDCVIIPPSPSMDSKGE